MDQSGHFTQSRRMQKPFYPHPRKTLVFVCVTHGHFNASLGLGLWYDGIQQTSQLTIWCLSVAGVRLCQYCKETNVYIYLTALPLLFFLFF